MPIQPDPTAVTIALAYHRAWTAGDFELAMTHISPDVVCLSPAGKLVGADAFRGFMGPFVPILVSSELLAVFGDEHTAALVYEARTVPVAEAPTCELITVQDQRIVQMRIIFDRAPFEAARAAARSQ
jgi:hypothetical protein